MSGGSQPLPSFEEAAKQAYAKAKAAGAGQFEPGSIKDTQRTVDAATGQGQLSEQKGLPIPPVVRSVLSFSGQAAMITSRAVGRASPGYVGGLLYQGRSFSYAAGFRDGSRGFDNEDKGNHLRLRDPMGLHTLTIPITALLAWRLHKAGSFDLLKPMTEHIPELPRQFDSLTPRDILSHRVALSDEGIFKSVGARMPSSWDTKAAFKFYDNVWKPVGEAFKGKTAAESRQALLTHVVKHHETLPRIRRSPTLRGRISHSAIALLAVALERSGNDTFENLIEQNVFRVIETPSAGFGAPKLINRSHIFYQPGGLPAGHWTSKVSVPPEDVRNAAPPVFNSSLNMFANAEEFAKMAIVFFEAAINATQELTPPTSSAGYHELGIWHNPIKKNFVVKPDPWMSDCVTTFSGAAEYNVDKDVGAFAISNCGNRRARFVNNFSTVVTSRLFTKQVVDTGMNIWEGQDQAPPGEGPDARVNLAAPPKGEEMDKLFDKRSIGKLFGGVDKHTRL